VLHSATHRYSTYDKFRTLFAKASKMAPPRHQQLQLQLQLEPNPASREIQFIARAISARHIAEGGGGPPSYRSWGGRGWSGCRRARGVERVAEEGVKVGGAAGSEVAGGRGGGGWRRSFSVLGSMVAGPKGGSRRRRRPDDVGGLAGGGQCGAGALPIGQGRNFSGRCRRRGRW